ncbi:MAG: hypothetical protein AAGC91_14200 [Pseudomonadota bacterium]
MFLLFLPLLLGNSGCPVSSGLRGLADDTPNPANNVPATLSGNYVQPLYGNSYEAFDAYMACFFSENPTCTIDVTDDRFTATYFSHTPNGLEYLGFKTQPRGFYGGSRGFGFLTTEAFPGTPLAAFLESEQNPFFISGEYREKTSAELAEQSFSACEDLGLYQQGLKVELEWNRVGTDGVEYVLRSERGPIAHERDGDSVLVTMFENFDITPTGATSPSSVGETTEVFRWHGADRSRDLLSRESTFTQTFGDRLSQTTTENYGAGLRWDWRSNQLQPEFNDSDTVDISRTVFDESGTELGSETLFSGPVSGSQLFASFVNEPIENGAAVFNGCSSRFSLVLDAGVNGSAITQREQIYMRTDSRLRGILVAQRTTFPDGIEEELLLRRATANLLGETLDSEEYREEEIRRLFDVF